MATLPNFLQDETEEQIRNRMLAAIPDDLDKNQGSAPYDTIAPAASEFAQAKQELQEAVRKGFASTAASKIPGEKTSYLDLRVEEHGLIRRPATKATGTAKFTGEQGVIIPAGQVISTASTTSMVAVKFVTTKQGTIAEDGFCTVPIEAMEAGASGNVAGGKIIFIEEQEAIEGLEGVTNEQATAGGHEEEDDISLLDRFFQKVRSSSAGGNKADYQNWTLEVPGVGGVSVIPVKDGPGTVGIYIIDTNKMPASLSLVEAVQAYIAPPWTGEASGSDFTLGGQGTSLEDDAIKMEYDAGGEGNAAHDPQEIIRQPGIWLLIPRMKVDSTAGEDDLLQIGVYDVTDGVWCKTRPEDGTDAMITIKASELGASYANGPAVQFFTDGLHTIEARISRLQTDTTTTVWIEKAEYRSTFSKDTGDGKAPIGHRATVEAAIAVLINISVHLTLKPGYDLTGARAAVQAAIEGYLKAIAFNTDNDIRYTQIGTAILDTPGIADYDNLTINGATANIAIGENEVAVLGTVTWL